MSGVAEINEATLSPSKLEIIASWLPKQAWFSGSADDVVRVASFRFVDPDGEVGIETMVVRSQGVSYQVPLTYRGEPLAEAERSLMGTMEHSTLGRRWVYDAVGDPVYVTELFRVIHEGDTEADLSSGEKTMTAEGSGIPVVSNAAGQSARIVRILDDAHVPEGRTPLGTLTGHWVEDGAERTAILAVLR